jgi:hypothetical protein
MTRHLIFYLIVINLFLPLQVFAQGSGPFGGPIVPCGRQGQPDCTLCHFFEMARNIITSLLGFAIIIAPIFIIIGGIVILTAAGKPGQMIVGRKIISSAIIGVIVAFLSWTILNTIFNALIGGEGFPWPWNEFRC